MGVRVCLRVCARAYVRVCVCVCVRVCVCVCHGKVCVTASTREERGGGHAERRQPDRESRAHQRLPESH